MSVIGFDIGNENCYVAVARAGGIETIANEYSQRSTPTYVALSEKTRDLGVTAKNKQITNISNTLFSFKHLIGRLYKDPVTQQELQYIPYDTLELPNGEVGFQVNYLGEKTVFTAQQVMGMMFTKLKEIAESNLRIKVQDCVISVPIYYTDKERRAILESAEIAGLHVLRLMNETTAVSLAYGFYKQDLTEDNPKFTVFVDLGHSSLQVTACEFSKGKLKILGSAWERNLGGRDFDNVLVKHFAEDFGKRYKLDIMNNKRAVVRLMQECEKLKKQMSANSLDLPLNIECFMNDKDVSGRMKREDFENLCSNILERIEHLLKKFLHETNLNPADIDSVQIVGGSSRIPAFKSLIQKVFSKEPSTTLNLDEAVARGCALQCAMLSPTFKVRDFSITDIQPYPLMISYKTVSSDEESSMEIFRVFHPVPYSRLLTFYRTEPFAIDVHYAEDRSAKNVQKIGTFTIQNIVPTAEGESVQIKVKARVNLHGIFSICSATMVEKSTVANEQSNGSNVETSKEEPMDSESAPPNGDIHTEDTSETKTEKKENSKHEKKKAVVKNIELPISCNNYGLSRHTIDEMIEKEAKMIMHDKMEKEKADAKNAVEEFVYDFRGKLSAELEKFATDQEKDFIRNMLEETENWLYDEGEDQQKSVYVQKLNSLKKPCDLIIFRYNEWEQRPNALNAFGSSLQLVHKALQSYQDKEETYSHIDEEDMVKVRDAWQEKDKWYGSQLQPFSKLQPHENPHTTVADIKKQREELESIVVPILSKPKPKVTPPPPEQKDVNGQPQTESDMQDADTAEKVDKKDDPSCNKNTPQQNAENMETN